MLLEGHLIPFPTLPIVSLTPISFFFPGNKKKEKKLF